MTRIFTDGAEMGDMLFWTIHTNGAIATTPTPVGGIYSYQFGNDRNATKVLSTAISECYLRFRMYRTAPLTDWYYTRKYPQFRNNVTELMSMGQAGDSDFRYVVRVGGGNVAYSPIDVIWLADRWILVEQYYKIADSGGRVVIKLDGNIAIDYTGDTLYGTNSTFDNIYFYHNTGTVYLDDLALNDTAGGVDDGYCGDGIVVKLTPSGSSTTANNWLNSGSVSGSANYLYVDEYPADGDTTYTYASASSTGLQTQFALSDFTIAGTTITRVFAEGRARKTSTNSYGVKIGDLASGGTDVMSGSQVLSVGAYTCILGSEQKINPVTSASWTAADVNGLELVLEIP